MSALLIEKSRTNIRAGAFYETVIWLLPEPVLGSQHNYKYRLALVINEKCVLRSDNERGKAALKSAYLVKTAPATPSLNFVSYDDMHRVLAPARLKIVKALAGQGVLSIREVARRVDRDAQAVHRDVQTLISAGVIDRDEKGVEFPYDRIHFDFDVSVAA